MTTTMSTQTMAETFRFIERLYEGRDGARLTRDDVIGRAEQAGLPHDAVNLFGHLPPGPFLEGELREVTAEWLGRESEE